MMSQEIKESLQQIFNLKRATQLLHDQSHTSVHTAPDYLYRLKTQKKVTRAVPLMGHKKKAAAIISLTSLQY